MSIDETSVVLMNRVRIVLLQTFKFDSLFKMRELFNAKFSTAKDDDINDVRNVFIIIFDSISSFWDAICWDDFWLNLFDEINWFDWLTKNELEWLNLFDL
jgi:hypothetical protein